ncbi:B-cell receptor CD22-like [Fundulus diaphanus]
MLAGSGRLVWTLLLLIVGGVLSNRCFVEYSEETMCAVRGSTVIFLCLFQNIERREIDRFMWGHTRSSNFRLILSHPGHGFGRYEYIGDKERNCSMKIHKVEFYDAGKYFFRFNMNKGCLTKRLTLKVIDLNILVQNADGDEIQEGDSVTLTCINSCDGHDASSMLSWFKDGKAINEGPVLQLKNVSTEHSGNYTCSLKSQKGTTSAVARVVVEHGPQNTSVLMGTSSEAGADGGMVLICSSEAQPPVQNYSWFRTADGQTLTVGRQAELSAVHAGQYLCSVSNKHGSQNSTVFTLKTKPYWETFMRDILIIVTGAVLLAVSTIIAVCRLAKNKTRILEATHQQEIQVVLFCFLGLWCS